MCLSNEAAAIKLAERDNLVGELVEAASGALEILWREHGNGYGTKYEKAIALLQQAVEKGQGAQS